jgi:valine dehydrogenase (NAD+)
MSNQVFEPKIDQPQQVVCKELNDRTSALICINSTALGPALGGLRFYPYASIEDAREDVTRLAQAMSYKNALAGLSFGGGKAVIVGDPEIDKTPRLLERFGQLVESLQGNYLTACDVGTTVSDMDVIARTCTHVLSRSVALGGAGDPSVLTSYGVYRAMQACIPRSG